MNVNVRFRIASESLQIFYKLVKRQIKIYRHDVSIHFFDVVLFLLSSLFTGPSFKSVFFYTGLTRNLKIKNTPVWVLRLGHVRNIKFGKNVSNRISLNDAKCYGCSFYRFWVIKGKPTGRGKIPPPPNLPTQIRIKTGSKD